VAETAIRAVEDKGDVATLDRIFRLIQSPFEEHDGDEAFAAPPPPETAAGFAPPGTVRWTRTAQLGGSFTSGSFKQGQLDPTIPGLPGAVLKWPGNQYTAQGNLTLVRATNMGVAFLDTSLTYAVYDPFGKQADLPKASVGYNFRFKEKTRMYGVTKYTYYEDQVKHVDYSNQLLFGLGFRAMETKRVKLDLVPGLTVIKEKKGTRFDGNLLAGYGGLESLTFSPNPYSSIEHRETFYQTFNDTSYYGLESYLGFKGFLSKNMGVTIGFTNIIDNAIAGSITQIPANALFAGQPAFGVFANNRVQTLITAGILIKF